MTPPSFVCAPSTKAGALVPDVPLGPDTVALANCTWGGLAESTISAVFGPMLFVVGYFVLGCQLKTALPLATPWSCQTITLSLVVATLLQVSKPGCVATTVQSFQPPAGVPVLLAGPEVPAWVATCTWPVLLSRTTE